MDINIKLLADISRTQEVIDHCNTVYGETRKDFIGFKPDGSQYVYNDYFSNKNQIRDSIMNNEVFIAEVVQHQAGNQVCKLAGCIRIVESVEDQGKVWQEKGNKKQFGYQTLAVAGEFRGQGVATKLVKFAENMALEKGYSEINCDTFMFGSDDGRDTYRKCVKFAQSWYERMGYVVTESYSMDDHPRYAAFKDRFQPGIIAVYFKKQLVQE